MSWAMLQFSQPGSVRLPDTLLVEPVARAAAAEQGYAGLEVHKVNCPVHSFAQDLQPVMVVPAGDLFTSEVWTIPAAPAHQRPVSSQQLPMFQPGSSAASLGAIQLQPPGAFCRVTLASSHQEVCQPVTVQLLLQAQPQMPPLIQPCRQPQLQLQEVQHANTTVFFAGVTPLAQAGTIQAIFEHFGAVCDFNLFRPYKGCKTSKGCGLVVFSQHSEAALALETLHGQFVWPGAASPMIVEWCDPGKQHKKKRSQHTSSVPAEQLPAAACTNDVVLQRVGDGLFTPSTVAVLQQPVAPLQPGGLQLSGGGAQLCGTVPSRRVRAFSQAPVTSAAFAPLEPCSSLSTGSGLQALLQHQQQPRLAGSTSGCADVWQPLW